MLAELLELQQVMPLHGAFVLHHLLLLELLQVVG